MAKKKTTDLSLLKTVKYEGEYHEPGSVLESVPGDLADELIDDGAAEVALAVAAKQEEDDDKE